MSKVPEGLPLPLMDISKLKNEARSNSKQSSVFKSNRKISTAGIESILLLMTKIMGLRTNGLIYISKYKCSGPPAFKSRRNKALYQPNQELMHRYQLAKNQLWIRVRTQQNNINFHLRKNSDKINDEIFEKFKKNYFWASFQIFGHQIFFQKNPALSRTISYVFLAPCHNLEKTNDPIPRKCPDRRKGWRTEGQSLFYRTLLVTAGTPTSYF